MAEKTFREAYGVLQQHAETLREQSEPNIDELLTIVTESVDAYKVCKARIDAVEKALEEALTGADLDGSAATAVAPAARPAARPARAAPAPAARAANPPTELDDDVPF